MKAKYKFEKESIASPDHFKPIRIRENLAVNYDAYYKVDKRDATFNKKKLPADMSDRYHGYYPTHPS